MVASKSTKKIRIVILLGAPLTLQNHERIGIPYLEKYFDVTVIDCMTWLQRDVTSINFQSISYYNYVSVVSKIDLDIQIKRIQPHYAIDAIGFCNSVSESILLTLKKYSVRCVLVRSGAMPKPNLGSRLINIFHQALDDRNQLYRHEQPDKVDTSIRCNRALSAISRILKRGEGFIKKKLFYRRLNKISPYIGLLAGTKSLDGYKKLCNTIIWTCSDDYHKYKKIKIDFDLNKNSRTKESFILFIDDNLPAASDWSLLGISPPVSERVYYCVLNIFFKEIEDIFGLPIKISGHPNSLIDGDYVSKMGGRTVSFGNTALLTLQSSLVLVHGSTATSFAVLAQKPIIHLTTKELSKTNYGSHIRTMSKALGTPIISIDDWNKPARIKNPKVNIKKYKCYEEHYLRSPLSTENTPWMGFIDFVKKGFHEM